MQKETSALNAKMKEVGIGEVCGQELSSYRAFVAHQTKKHKYRAWASLLTVTNCCPWCRGTFAAKQTTINHIHQAVEGNRRCTIDKGRWNHSMMQPHALMCPVCKLLAQDAEQLLIHLTEHAEGPLDFKYIGTKHRSHGRLLEEQ